MRMTVLTLGYRGDVQPMVTMAAGLRDAGHTVHVVAQEDFEGLVRGAGLQYRRLSGKMASFMSGAAGAALRERVESPERFARFVESYLNHLLPKLYDEVWEACHDSEAIFGCGWSRMLPSLAERLQIACLVVSPFPVGHLP